MLLHIKPVCETVLKTIIKYGFMKIVNGVLFGELRSLCFAVFLSSIGRGKNYFHEPIKIKGSLRVERIGVDLSGTISEPNANFMCAALNDRLVMVIRDQNLTTL